MDKIKNFFLGEIKALKEDLNIVEYISWDRTRTQKCRFQEVSAAERKAVTHQLHPPASCTASAPCICALL